MPKEALAYVCEAFFEERTIGYNRFYSAHGAGMEIDELIRCYRDDNIRAGMYAVMEDGEQFRVSFVQALKDADNLEVMDITLARSEDRYDIAQ